MTISRGDFKPFSVNKRNDAREDLDPKRKSLPIASRGSDIRPENVGVGATRRGDESEFSDFRLDLKSNSSQFTLCRRLSSSPLAN
jgi:hypothetical protein